MLLRVASVQESPVAGQVQVLFKALAAVPAAAAPAAPTATAQPVVRPQTGPYPGYNVIGQLQVQLSTADASPFTLGQQFELAVKG